MAKLSTGRFGHILDEFHIPYTRYVYRSVSVYALSVSVYARIFVLNVSVYALKDWGLVWLPVDNWRVDLLPKVSLTI